MAAIVCRVMVALALLLVTTPAWAQAAAQGGLQGFGIVLVLGDVQEGATTDNIPAAARAALSDLKDFLPYNPQVHTLITSRAIYLTGGLNVMSDNVLDLFIMAQVDA